MNRCSSTKHDRSTWHLCMLDTHTHCHICASHPCSRFLTNALATVVRDHCITISTIFCAPVTVPKPSNPSDSTALATIGCMQALTKCPPQLEHWLQMQNEQVESLTTSLKRSRAETACLNKEMMRQFARFKSFRSSHSQVLTNPLRKCMLVHREDV